MTVHAGTARPQRVPVTTAMLRVLVTLGLFFIVFIPFLIAPLLTLAAGFLVYVVWRSRGARPRPSHPGAPTTTSASGFGAGAS